MGLADITQIPVPKGPPAVQLWTGVPNSTDTVLVTNTDLNNTVFLGTRPQISAAGLNVIPLLPNASLTLAANRSWFVVGAVAGIANLLVIPGASAAFLGLTQGLGQLSIPAIKSPNFVTGVSGWSINKDGSAEFNNVTVRGTIVASRFVGTGVGQEILIYSGTPAANNLVASVCSADFTDSFGNQGFAGLCIFTPFTAGQARLHRIPGGAGQNAGMIFMFSTVGQNTWQQGSSIVPQATTSLTAFFDVFTSLPVTGGVVQSFNTPLVILSPKQAATPVTLSASAGNLWSNNQGTLQTQDVAGFQGNIPADQVDISTHGPGNVVTATDITKSWSIPAGDSVAGTIYEIETYVTVAMGATATETITFGVDINGTLTALTTLGASFNGAGVGLAYAIPLKLRLIVDAIGVNTPFIHLGEAGLGQTSANRLSTNSSNMPGHSSVATFNKANVNTLAIYAQWGGTGGVGQLAQAVYSELIRKGP